MTITVPSKSVPGTKDKRCDNYVRTLEDGNEEYIKEELRCDDE